MATRSIGDIKKSNGQNPIEDSISPLVPHADLRTSGGSVEKNELNELGQKIFLDRYALKDMHKRTLAVGDMVIVCVDDKTGQREIGTVRTMEAGRVSVELRDGVIVDRLTEHVSKPIETEPEQMMERVARGIAAVEGENAEEWYHKFRWLLNGWKFVPAGRILTAAGSDQQLTFYNCYVIPSPKDSRRGIVDTLSQMMEIMSRGGGVGINISSLRSRHSYVKGVNGRSSGSVSWGGLYSFVTGLIEQGGSRRGALMLILNCWHPDVLEFINSKREMGKITNANISVGITDRFMQAVEQDADWDLVFADTSDPNYEAEWDGNLDKWVAAGRKVVVHKTVKARFIWNSIIESAWTSAEPGVFFLERANKMSNSWYYDEGYLGCTNPCVTGDTLVYTGQGLIRAGELFARGQAVETVLDGRFGRTEITSSASPVFRTGRKPVYRLQTKQGYYLRATGNHRIMTSRGWVELKDLLPSDQVHILNRKGGFGIEGSLDLGRSLGWLIGDGTIKQDRAVLSFFGEEKQLLAPMFAAHVNKVVAPMSVTNRVYDVGVVDVAQRDEARVQSQRLRTLAAMHGLTETKHRVPEIVFKGSEEMQRGFLQALFTADGGFQDGGEKGGSVRLASSYPELLEGVQQLLLNFGVASRLYRNRRPAGNRLMPDGKGGEKLYWCREQHELAVTKQNLMAFADDIGFLMPYKQLSLEDYISRGKRGPYSEHFTATVESVTPDGVEDVFDLTEPLTHSFVGNGVVIHNCGEQPLPGFGVCNLGAINLSKFVSDGEVAWDDLGKAVRYSVRFLDNVIDATPYFFDENLMQQRNERRVGLNTMGMAEMMIRLGIRYGSEESVQFIDRLYRFIASESYHASADIAAEKGAFPMFEAEKFLQSGYMEGMPEDVREVVREKGVRNVTLLTQAPNGTIGTMVGTSTGIEPFYFWSYYRKSRLGQHEERVKVLEEWQSAHPGESLPGYFVTAMDLSPEEHVKVQAAIQRWVDSSISKTCNLPNSYSVDQTREIYELLYRLGCKGGTIYRDGSRDVQVLNLKEEDKKKPAPAPEARRASDDPAPAKEASPASSSASLVQGDSGLVPKVRPRPYKRRGYTVSKATPSGTAHITMNEDEENQPFEVFVEIGKAGSDIKAMAEAMGRLMSLILRMASPVSPVERVREIVKQISGIGGARSYGFGKRRVLSLPDAVGQALAENYLDVSYGDEEEHAADRGLDTGDLVLPAKQKAAALQNASADLCPSCGDSAFVRIEGCHSCYACGYSEC